MHPFFPKGFDLYSACISAFTITMMIINLMGMMFWWDISLNAISLVNLVVVSSSFDKFYQAENLVRNLPKSTVSTLV